MRIQEIRELAAKTLHELGFADSKPASESLLIKDRYYLGCRFSFDGISALWLEEAGQLRFIDDTGKLVKIVKLNAGKALEVAQPAA